MAFAPEKIKHGKKGSLWAYDFKLGAPERPHWSVKNMSQSLQGIRVCGANISRRGSRQREEQCRGQVGACLGARDEEHEEMALEGQECQTV